MNNFELMHYGVLGMKWGVRRYQNKDGTLTTLGKRRGGKYKYKSHTTKKYERKAAKSTDVAKKKVYSQRAKRSSELDKKEQDIAEQMSTAKVIVTRLMTGGFNAKPYQRARAMGSSKVASAAIAAIGGYPVSMIRKRRYITQDER